MYGVEEAFASGELRPISLPAADAVAGLAYRVPGSSALTVEALCFRLVTVANAANRQVIVRVQDTAGTDCYAVAAPGTQGTTLTVTYSFAPLVPPAGSSALGFQTGPFPRATLPQNTTLVVTVVNAVAGDMIENVRLLACAEPVTGEDDE